MATTSTPHQLIIEEIRKNKKTEPKIFPFLLMVDKEAFGKLDEQVFILKSFWRSEGNKIAVARKADTQSIVGYACYQTDSKTGGVYLMRIGVRSKCQRQGIGRQLMDYLFTKFPKHLALDVSTDNVKAVNFYQRVGLVITETYLSEEKVEFNKFETPSTFKHVKWVPRGAAAIEEQKGGCGECWATPSGKKSESDDTETLVSDSEMIEQ